MADKQTILQDLHDEISSTMAQHPERVQSLEMMQQHIRAAMESEDHPETLTERLNEAILQFENDHPGLASAIRNAVSILSQGGV